MSHRLVPTSDVGFPPELAAMLAKDFPAIAGPWAPWHEAKPFSIAILDAAPDFPVAKIDAVAHELLNRFGVTLARATAALPPEMTAAPFLEAVVEHVQAAVDAMVAEKILPARFEPVLRLATEASPPGIDILYRNRPGRLC